MPDSITTRIDNVSHIPAAYLKETVPCPPSVKVELCNTCNLKCAMCGIGGRDKPGKEVIDLAVFERFIGEFVGAGGEEVGLFFIGESTVSPKTLIDALRICKKLGVPYTFLTTNGTLLTPMLAGELMEEGLDSLKFSVNFESPEAFARGTRTKGALWGKALANLKAAYELRNAGGYKTKIYASSILFNGEEQRAQMESVLEERVRPFTDSHYFLPCFSEMASVNNVKETRGWKVNAGNQGRADNKVDPLPCWSLFREAHVRLQKQEDGTIKHMMSMCCFGATPTFDAASLDDMSFMDAWNSLAYRELRRAHLSGDVHGTVCQSCIHGDNTIPIKAA